MKKLVILHLAGAAVTTAFYAWMTGGDTVYVLAMIALYLWVLGTVARRRAGRPGTAGKGKSRN